MSKQCEAEEGKSAWRKKVSVPNLRDITLRGVWRNSVYVKEMLWTSSELDEDERLNNSASSEKNPRSTAKCAFVNHCKESAGNY